MFLACCHVCRHTPERNRQIIEALQIVVRHHRLVQKQSDRRTRVEPARQTKPVLQTKFETIWVGKLVLLPPVIQRLKRQLAAENGSPVNTTDKLGNLLRTEA